MIWTFIESLEHRRLLTAAQDITSLTALRADAAYTSVDGSGIGVAVLDSGTWAAHPDLRDNFVAFFDAVRSSSSSPGSTNVNDAFDPDGHGTHTAGTAVSSNPGVGVATRARLIAVRALPADNEPQPQFDTVANGLQWVLNNVTRFNIKVVNMSLGVPTVNDNTGRITDQESVLIRRLENAGVTVVSAAGNNYAAFAPNAGSATPGAYSTLIVSNTWADTGRAGLFPIISGGGGGVRFFAQESDAAPDRFAATSQRATINGSIAAPGSDIFSTWNDPNKPYQFLSGTSMAAPFVAGAAALMQDAAFTFGGRYLTPQQVRTILLDSADTIVDSNVPSNSRIPVTYDSNGNPRRAGSNVDLPETGLSFKRIDVYKAVQTVRALVTTGDATPPSDNTPPPQPPPGTDPDAAITSANEIPPLDGSEVFSFTGSVGNDGPVVVGSGDVDVYKLTVRSTGSLSAALSLPTGGSGLGLGVRLFNAAGQQLQVTQSSSASTYPTLTTAALSPGTYYLGVSGAGNLAYTVSPRGGAVSPGPQGDYTLTVGLNNPDPNGVISGAVFVDLLAPNAFDTRITGDPAAFRAAGTLGSDPNPLNDTGTRVPIGAVDVDMFRITAPDDGLLTVDTYAAAALSGGVNSFVRLFDEDGNELTPSGTTFVGGTDMVAQIRLTRGQTVFAAVSTAGNQTYNPNIDTGRTSTTGQTGVYDVYFSFDNDDVNGNAFDAVAVAVGQTVNGIVGSDNGVQVGAADDTKDVDFVRIPIPDSISSSGALIDLRVTPTTDGFTPVLGLWRLAEDRQSIIKETDTAGRASRIISFVSPGESIYLSVTGNGNDDFRWSVAASGTGGESGAYTLTSSVRPLTDLNSLINSSILFGTPTPLAPNVPVYANLGTTNSVETGASSVNLYRFVATFTGPATFRAAVPPDEPTDPVLRLFDDLGEQLAINDDADTNTRDAQITFDLVAGQTYYLGVSSIGNTAYDPVTGDGATDGSTQGDYVLLASVPQRLTISGGIVTRATDGSASLSFILSLAEPATLPVSADFSTFDPGGLFGGVAGSDYTAVSTRVTIPVGQTSATVSVPLASNTTPGRAVVVGGLLANLTNARKGTSLTATATVRPASAATPSTTAPDLVATSITLAPSAPIVPGDKVPATLLLTQAGVGRLSGRFSLRTVISPDPFPSAADPLVMSVRTVSLNLLEGRTSTQRLSLTIPASLEAGQWYVISTLTPLRDGTDASTLNNVAVSDVQQVQWLFGTYASNRRNRALTVINADGNPIRFALTGPGSGTVSRDDSNLLSAVVTGTTATSAFSITPPRRTTSEILDLSISTPLRSLLSPAVAVVGALSLPTPPPATVKILGR